MYNYIDINKNILIYCIIYICKYCIINIIYIYNINIF